MSSLPIDLSNVSKTFPGRVQALRGVRMQVHPGEIFGLLGPNGAGKSTLVKIIMTVVRATTAGGTVLGERVGHKPTLRRIGYLPEHHRFPRYLTGRQAIELFGGLFGLPRRELRRRTDELLEVVRMTEWADRAFGTYSKGMQQRIGLAAALVGSPDLVLLDEPTDGVDPVGRREIRDVLLELKRRGCAVFLNSHLLSELEMVCDRVAIMVQGMVVAQGTIQDLTKDSRRYEIVCMGGPPDWLEGGLEGGLAKGLAGEADEPGLVTAIVEAERTRIVLRTSDPEDVQATIDRLRAEQRTLVAVTPVRESLEDLFLRAVTDQAPGEVAGPGAHRPKQAARRAPAPSSLAREPGR